MVLTGKVKIFDEMGKAIPSEFWLANNFRGYLTAGFRLRARDLRAAGLVADDAATQPDPTGKLLAPSGELPADLAKNQKTVAAYDAIFRYD